MDIGRICGICSYIGRRVLGDADIRKEQIVWGIGQQADSDGFVRIGR